MLSNSSLHFYWDFLVAFFVDSIVTVVMVFVLIVNIAVGVLGVIARLAVYGSTSVPYMPLLWYNAFFTKRSYEAGY